MLFVAFENSGFDVTAVGGNTGNAEESALLVHVFAHLVGSVAFLVHDVCNNGRVDGTAACAHENAVKGSEAHGSINALAALNCGDGRAVSDVAGDNLCVLNGFVKELSHFAGYISVGSTVSTVAADVILFVHIVGNAVHISLNGHCLMESCVKYQYLRLVGHYCDDIP